MAARRSLAPALNRLLTQRAPRQARSIFPALAARHSQQRAISPHSSTRTFSHSSICADTNPKTSSGASDAATNPSPPDITPYTYSEIQALSSNRSASRILIDVREPAELRASGRIPGAQSLPINSNPDGLFLPADEFEDRFGFPKPGSGSELVFYCKAGVRSRAAARVAQMAGWERVGEYGGSFVDWEGNGGEVER